MKTQYLQSISSQGLHRIAYTEWGDSNNPNVLVCSHGLTRNKHDFDTLASKLSEQYRVICYDFPGRGESDWLSNKMDYDYQQYTVDALMLIARTGVKHVDWLGTSMGGLQGMILAAMPNSPIRNLILNDVGPFIAKESLAIIASYLGKKEVFNSLKELEQYLKITHAGFGKLSDEQWQQLAINGHRRTEDGKITLRYDPDITQAFSQKNIEDVNLWPLWETIQQRTLLIHGEDSALLDIPTSQKMAMSGPCAQLLNIPHTGHAPALMNSKDINAISQWLNSARKR